MTVFYLPNDAMRRSLGAYYTPSTAADFMAQWLVRHDGEHVLEPSVGDGTFLRAVARSAARKGFNAMRVSGVEIDPQTQAGLFHQAGTAGADVWCADFLSVSPFPVQAVIGNPPYVRLRHLEPGQQQRALLAAQAVLGQPMETSGSVWMPFVLHAMRFLSRGGRLAFVLPYDMTYVRYARPLWQYLGQRFGSLQVLRAHERLFPELLQDVVILLADGYGACTDTVHYQAFERVDDLLHARPVVDERLDIPALLRGERAFIGALLGEELRGLLDTRLNLLTVPAREKVTFNIGYVAGDKEFFHPAQQEIERNALPGKSLHPSLAATRTMKNAGLWTSSVNAHTSRLFLPDPDALTNGERDYIAQGVEAGVAARYKCRIRSPWFVVPGVRVPDVVLSVFSERPLLLLNDAGCFASNSLLCGFCAGSAEELATAWYTSLTLLQCEMEVHALGGGVMVLVPGEAGNVRLPRHVLADTGHLSGLDRLLRDGKTADAYAFGDRAVLTAQLGITIGEVELIRHGVRVLTHWRTSARSSLNPASFKHVPKQHSGVECVYDAVNKGCD